MIKILIFLLLLILIIYFLCYFKNNEYFSNTQYTAVIIEPREHKAFQFVLENFVENLSNSWNIIIFHGNKNINYINNIIKSSKVLTQNLNRIKLINLNVDNLTIKEYNNLLISRDFYKNIPTEIFLIFQTDSIICESNKSLINNYLTYDYVGAPWKDKSVGNGGLSLRKKSKMLEIINNCPYSNENEDIYFSRACSSTKINIPTFDIAKHFSVETVYDDLSFGVHKPWRYIKKEDLKKKNDYCKGLNTLTELNYIKK